MRGDKRVARERNWSIVIDCIRRACASEENRANSMDRVRKHHTSI